MIIVDYDKNPQLNTDRKLISLCESIQRAINELETELAELRKEVRKLQDQ